MVHHLPKDEADDLESIKFIEEQLEEVKENAMGPLSSSDNDSNSEFIKFIEDQLETVNQDSVNSKNEILFNVPKLNSRVCKIEDDITKLPQVAKLLHDFDIFESETLPPYETDQMVIQESNDWAVMGEDLNNNFIQDNDKFYENLYVTEEEWQFLLGNTSDIFTQNENVTSSGHDYEGSVANYGSGGGGGWEGEVVSPSFVKYGFFVQVINGVTVWRWLGRSKEKETSGDHKINVKSKSKPMTERRTRKEKQSRS